MFAGFFRKEANESILIKHCKAMKDEVVMESPDTKPKHSIKSH